MRPRLFVCVYLVICFLTGFAYANEVPFVVVIPSYNNAKWYQKNLDSVFSQEYHNYRVIYVDDASPDGTGALVEEYLKEKSQKKRTTLIRNKQRVGALANLHKAIWMCDPDEVVVCLDGDDWQHNNKVLARLNSAYSDPEVWITYGQFEYYDGDPGWAAQLPQEIIEQNDYRGYDWVTTAQRTFYAALFQKIEKEDLLYHGEFYPMGGDQAYMWPMLEMAGKHSRFIPDVLYVYNVQTGIHDHMVDYPLQAACSDHSRANRRYQPLERLF